MARRTDMTARLTLLCATAYGVMTLAALAGQINRAEAARDALAGEVRAVQAEIDGLAAALHSLDGAGAGDKARGALGLVMPGEKIIYYR